MNVKVELEDQIQSSYHQNQFILRSQRYIAWGINYGNDKSAFSVLDLNPKEFS